MPHLRLWQIIVEVQPVSVFEELSSKGESSPTRDLKTHHTVVEIGPTSKQKHTWPGHAAKSLYRRNGGF